MPKPEQEPEKEPNKVNKLEAVPEPSEPVLDNQYMQELQKRADEEREKENRKEEKIEKLKEELETEQSREEILDALELAFNENSLAKLIVLEPSGELKTSNVFVEGLEGDVLYVSLSKSSAVQGINLNDVRGVK